MAIDVNALANEIVSTIKEYTDEVIDKVEKAADAIADEGVRELRNTSPKDTGGYAKGWTVKKTQNGKVIYNKNKPQLTHLLEKGYAKVNGGRVAGVKHIEPVEEKIVNKFVEKVEEAIKG